MGAMARRPILALTLAFLLSGCAALDPTPVDSDTRLAALPTRDLPLDRPVTIRWNDHAVPWIEAETDHDLGFTLGLVHGHLRGTQVRLLKHIALGRLAEVAGPPAVEIDHALRLIGFGRSAPQVLAAMKPEDRAFLQAFVDGLNHQQAHQPQHPPEFALLGLEPEPFLAEALIAIGRLAGTDVTWLALFGLLDQRDQPDWPETWRRTLEAGTGLGVPVRDVRDAPKLDALRRIIESTAKSGSNSVVVSAARSASGAPLVANDPHLGLILPNVWILAGMRSPSYHAVGLMIPGLPIIAVGRNPGVAWGGTNLRSANSDVFDVTRVPDLEVTEETARIDVRFWFDAERPVRMTPFGPIVSDADLVPARKGEHLALSWIGHRPSDEIGALLAAMRARDAGEFRAAFDGFGLPPQNMVVADTAGQIRRFTATVVPRRPYDVPPDLTVDARDPANHWTDFADAGDLPERVDPPEGFLVSANDRPEASQVPVGWFFSAGERAERLRQLLSGPDPISADDLAALQRDTMSIAAARLAGDLASRIAELTPEVSGRPVAQRLLAWDGNYAVDSTGAPAFELILHALVPRVAGVKDLDDVPPGRRSWNWLVRYLIEDLDALGRDAARAALTGAVVTADARAGKFPTWGDMHRMEVRHVLAALPVLGGAFVYESWPVGGSRETVMKTAHDLVDDVHRASYGSQARHISDLADPDANQFVLFGGQDGWMGSANFTDQLPLWRAGTYLRVPLLPETVARDFARISVLTPPD